MAVRRRAGFTIVEVLVVLVLAAVVSLWAGLAVYRQWDRTALSSSAERVLQMARYARLLAGEHHRPCQLHIDLDAGRYWLTAQEMEVPVGQGGGQAGSSEGEVVAGVYARPGVLPEQLRFSRVQVADGTVQREGKTVIAFHADGSAEAAVVQISSKKETQTLLIYPWTAKAVLKAGAVDDLPSEVVGR